MNRSLKITVSVVVFIIVVAAVVTPSVGWKKCRRAMKTMADSMASATTAAKAAVAPAAKAPASKVPPRRSQGGTWGFLQPLVNAFTNVSDAPPQGSAPQAPVAPGYMNLGAQAPLLTDAYGYSNPVTITPLDGHAMSAADRKSGEEALREHIAAAKAISMKPAAGNAGDGVDKVGASGVDLKLAYGDALKTVDWDQAEKDANAAKDKNPIKPEPVFEGPYDDDSVSLTAAYGNAYSSDKTSSPKTLTPQGVADAAASKALNVVVENSRISGNPIFMGLGAPAMKSDDDSAPSFLWGALGRRKERYDEEEIPLGRRKERYDEDETPLGRRKERYDEEDETPLGFSAFDYQMKDPSKAYRAAGGIDTSAFTFGDSTNKSYVPAGSKFGNIKLGSALE
jgi:hypothetical protein